MRKTLNNNALNMKKKKNLKNLQKADKFILHKINEDLFQIKHFHKILQSFVIICLVIKLNQEEIIRILKQIKIIFLLIA